MYPPLNYSSHQKSLFFFGKYGKYHKNRWICYTYVSLPECTHLSPVRDEGYRWNPSRINWSPKKFNPFKRPTIIINKNPPPRLKRCHVKVFVLGGFTIGHGLMPSPYLHSWRSSFPRPTVAPLAHVPSCNGGDLFGRRSIYHLSSTILLSRHRHHHCVVLVILVVVIIVVIIIIIIIIIIKSSSRYLTSEKFLLVGKQTWNHPIHPSILPKEK